MATIDDILHAAQQRAATLDLPYAGAVSPQEAFTLWQNDQNCFLVDVRTQAEWDWVGYVPDSVRIEWNRYPGGVRNPDFIAELESQLPLDARILFLCRSGVRSDGAARAATEAGFAHCYNILEGFEGDKDANGHRNKVGGWRHAGLPWHQG